MTRRRLRRVALLAVVALLAAVVVGADPLASPVGLDELARDDGTSPDRGDIPQSGDYDRDAFAHWTDPDGNGCDARDDVLVRDFDGESTDACEVVAGTGTLVSLWDGATVTDPGDADIDHVVSLSDAWRSGAHSWTDARREEFANDQRYLVAVTASSNRSKGDQGPDGWAPDLADSTCTYLALYDRAKAAYGLTVTDGQRSAIAAAGC